MHTDRVYVVTGGTRGIGAAIAQGLRDAGAKVCVMARKPDPADGVAVDLSDPSSVPAALV